MFTKFQFIAVALFLATTVNISKASNFSVNYTTGCVPHAVHFTSTSANVSSCIWDFGNGATSTLSNPSCMYATPGTYTVRLIINHTNGSVDTVYKPNYITVVPMPSADFSIDTLSGCEGNSAFTFFNTSLNANSWFWDFGDGNSSTLENPTHTYSVAGNYTVKLLASNAQGCNDLKVSVQNIRVLEKPHASFSANPLIACSASDDITFNNSSTGAASFIWKLDSGYTTSHYSPVYNYSNYGIYNVTLIATAGNGCSDTLSRLNYIRVNAPLATPDFTADLRSGCAPLSFVNFSIDSTLNNGSYSWNFGDGTGSPLNNPTHTYQTAGNYKVSLTYSDTNGCTVSNSIINYIHVDENNISPDFTSIAAENCHSLAINFTNSTVNANSYTWSFGDGDSSTLNSPSHTYATSGIYIVNLISNNNNGCSKTITDTVSIIMPSADFNADITTSNCPPLSVHFSNLSSEATNYHWFFGDGDSSVSTNPTHIYTNTGTYPVMLISTNSLGCKDTVLKNNYITIVSENYVTPDTIKVCAPFTLPVSYLTPGVVSYLWNFGDGSTSTQATPRHVYTNAGTFIISLNVTLNNGCTLDYPVYLICKVEKAVAAFNFETPECAPATITFADSSEGAVSWYWNLGDSSHYSYDQNPMQTYTEGYFTVSLTVKTSLGCSNTIIKSNVIYIPPCNLNDSAYNGAGGFGSGDVLEGDSTVVSSSDNSVMQLSGCAPLKINFYNTKPEAISYLWIFGDGTTSNLANPIHTYTASGVYTPQMYAYYNDGSMDSVLSNQQITVYSGTAQFDYLKNFQCNPFQVNFTDSSQNASMWLWNFGDNSYSSIQQTSHIYADTGRSYNATLSITTPFGCVSSLSKNISLVNRAFIFPDKSNACVNDEVIWNCTDTLFVSYSWDFGDGYTSQLPSPHHSYTSSGTYQSTLYAIDAYGCNYVFKSRDLNVRIITPGFSFSPNTNCNSFAVSFTDSSVSSNTWSWDFGDGTTSAEQNPTHIYSNYGTYQVKLNAGYDNICISELTRSVTVQSLLSASINFTQNKNCLPVETAFSSTGTGAVSWLWNFGDGTTSTQQNPSHVYNSIPAENITLVVKDSKGCELTVTKNNITIFRAQFSLSDTIGCGPLTVSFSSQSTYANSFWDFGDSTVSYTADPQHTYTNKGNYAAMLIAVSAEGCADTAKKVIRVDRPSPGFGSLSSSKCAPFVVSFTDSSSNTNSWQWNFGDGSASSKTNPVHVYNVPGDYTVSLTVSDGVCTDSLVKVNYVHVAGPISSYTTIINNYCDSIQTEFHNSSVNAIAWSWDFGDGNTSLLSNPVHTYLNPGTYHTSLVVKDSLGCTSYNTATSVISFVAPPVASFETDTITGCSPLSIHFANTSVSATNFYWNFGDGDTSVAQNPSHVYTHGGTFNVLLMAANNNGCKDIVLKNNYINVASPEVSFVSSTTTGCSPVVVRFTDSSRFMVSNAIYSWDFGNGATSSLKNPTISFTTPGTYNVTLTINNRNGCVDSHTQNGIITVRDFTPPSMSEIYSASVTRNNRIDLKWEKNQAGDFKKYMVYRKKSNSSHFDLITSIDNVSDTLFSDYGVDALHNSYCYKISTSDVCEYKLPLDTLNEHCTVNVTAKSNDENINVKWTPYIGAAVGSYSIYRKKTDGDETQKFVGNVNGATTQFTDTSIICTGAYFYRIVANKLNGKQNIKAGSDTSVAIPKQNRLDKQKPELVRSSVINNEAVITEWKEITFMPEALQGYVILRSTDNKNFEPLAKLSVGTTSYIDEDVKINEHNYHYRIETENICFTKGGESNKGSSILLDADVDNETINLKWSAYDEWEKGVDYYIIERQNENGDWIMINKLSGNKQSYKDE